MTDSLKLVRMQIDQTQNLNIPMHEAGHGGRIHRCTKPAGTAQEWQAQAQTQQAAGRRRRVGQGA